MAKTTIPIAMLRYPSLLDQLVGGSRMLSRASADCSLPRAMSPSWFIGKIRKRALRVMNGSHARSLSWILLTQQHYRVSARSILPSNVIYSPIQMKL